MSYNMSPTRRQHILQLRCLSTRGTAIGFWYIFAQQRNWFQDRVHKLTHDVKAHRPSQNNRHWYQTLDIEIRNATLMPQKSSQEEVWLPTLSIPDWKWGVTPLLEGCSICKVKEGVPWKQGSQPGCTLQLLSNRSRRCNKTTDKEESQRSPWASMGSPEGSDPETCGMAQKECTAQGIDRAPYWLDWSKKMNDMARLAHKWGMNQKMMTAIKGLRHGLNRIEVPLFEWYYSKNTKEISRYDCGVFEAYSTYMSQPALSLPNQ